MTIYGRASEHYTPCFLLCMNPRDIDEKPLGLIGKTKLREGGLFTAYERIPPTLFDIH